jgi:hypothetical protein
MFATAVRRLPIVASLKKALQQRRYRNPAQASTIPKKMPLHPRAPFPCRLEGFPALVQTVINAVFKFVPNPIGSDSQRDDRDSNLCRNLLSVNGLLRLSGTVIPDSQVPVVRPEFGEALSQTLESDLVINIFDDLASPIPSISERIEPTDAVLNRRFMPALVRFEKDVPGDSKCKATNISNLLGFEFLRNPVERLIRQLFCKEAVVPLEKFDESPTNLVVLLPCSDGLGIQSQEETSHCVLMRTLLAS